MSGLHVMRITSARVRLHGVRGVEQITPRYENPLHTRPVMSIIAALAHNVMRHRKWVRANVWTVSNSDLYGVSIQSAPLGYRKGKGTLLDRVCVHAKVVIFQYPKRLIFRDPFRYPSVFKNQFLNGCQGKRERETFCTFKWKAKRMGNSEEAMTLCYDAVERRSLLGQPK